MSKGITTIASVVLIILILGVAWIVTPETAFPIVMVLLVVFCMLLGGAICQNPLGILISEQNVISLSRFQTALWTVIIIAALLVIAIARIKNGVVADEDTSELADPLKITLSKELLLLLGISATSLVGSPLIAATKKSKTADPSTATSTAQAMVKLKNVPDSVKNGNAGGGAGAGAVGVAPAQPSAAVVASSIEQHAEGILYKNPSVTDASFSDMFEGNEVGNAAHIDLSKVQMFFFTVVIAVAYVVALWDVMSSEAIYGASFAFPAISTGMVGLLGISNLGYLGTKGVDHTAKS
jgi:hypothetical protein